MPNNYVSLSSRNNDPYWDQVVLLMHLDAANGSGVYVDIKGHPVSAATALANTATKKFGTSSARHIDHSTIITVPNHADFNFGTPVTADFTVELFAAVNSAGPGGGGLIGRWGIGPNTNADWLLFTDATRTFQWNGGGLSFNADIKIPDAAFHHLCAEYYNGTLTLFIDGTPRGARAFASSIPFRGADIRTGIWDDSASSVDGYIDEIRITKAARYKGQAFTVPVAAYPEF